jgi:CubicO group peptidase (beta-lactamase class C family)
MSHCKYILILSIFFGQISFAQLDFSSKNHKNNKYLSDLNEAISAGEFEQIKSVLIAKDGKVIFEKYYNGANQESKFNTRSATKTMATLLVGIAIEQNYIQSEKDKILTYLDFKKTIENPDKRKENVTIEDLLTMSSVAECNDWNNYSRGNEERMYTIEDWTGFYLDLPVRSYTFEPKPEEQAYGRSFSYYSAGAALLAEIVQSAIDLKLDEFAKKNLFKPLDIHDYELHYSPTGTLNTAGGSEYKSRDLLKLIQLCLNKGKWKGEQLLAESWLQKATTPKAKVDDTAEYGYLIWLKEYGNGKQYKSFYMSGMGGQRVVALPELKASIVITTTNYRSRNAHPYSDKIINDFIIPALEKL